MLSSKLRPGLVPLSLSVRERWKSLITEAFLSRVQCMCFLLDLCSHNVEFGNDHTVVRPTLCSSHGANVTASHYDVADQMPVFEAGMHPRCNRWNSVFVIVRSCSAQRVRSLVPFALTWPTPCPPNTPLHILLFRPTQTLKSPSWGSGGVPCPETDRNCRLIG